MTNKLTEQMESTVEKWIKANTEHRQWYICPKCSYQAPRFKDEWVGLTEQEQSDIAWEKDKSRIWIVTATEAKLKEKNNASS